MKSVKLGLCQGRHEIPGVEGYIFPAELDPADVYSIGRIADNALFDQCNLAKGDHIDLYVTGLTVALIEAIKACMWEGISITLWHFDRNTGEYFPQLFS